jgi:hypothetical protein
VLFRSSGAVQNTSVLYDVLDCVTQTSHVCFASGHIARRRRSLSVPRSTTTLPSSEGCDAPSSKGIADVYTLPQQNFMKNRKSNSSTMCQKKKRTETEEGGNIASAGHETSQEWK